MRIEARLGVLVIGLGLAGGGVPGCSNEPDAPAVGSQKQHLFDLDHDEISVDATNLPQTLNFEQSEQSIVAVSWNGNERHLLVAYNDYTEYTGLLGTKNGLAIGDDPTVFPMVWHTQQPLPRGPDVSILKGDPWLAVDGNTHSIVYYSSLARKYDAGALDGLAIAKSADGGKSWGNFRFLTEWQEGCDFAADKPSVATDNTGTNVFVAYVCQSPRPTVHVLVSTDGGTEWKDTAVPFDFDSDPDNVPAPIVQVNPTNQNRVFVSMQNQDPGGSFPLRTVLFTSSDSPWEGWGVPVVAATESLSNAVFKGANHDVRNGVYHSFAVDPLTGHCFIAYENGGKVKAVTSTNGTSWAATPDVSPDSNGKVQFQPVIAASRARIAIAWYEQLSATAPNTFMHVSTSSDHGVTWPLANSHALSGSLFGRVTWSPHRC